MTRNNQARILVVDDDRDASKAMVRLLQLESFDVAAASSAEEALTRAHDSIDLVVSDLRMKDTDGVDLLRAWKESNPQVPFILMTGDGDIGSATGNGREPRPS